MDCGLWTYWIKDMDSSLVVTVLSSSLSENFNFDLLKFLEFGGLFYLPSFVS